MTRILPYGTWPSSLAPEAIAAASFGLRQLVADGEALVWAESRPAEAGRTALGRWRPGGVLEDVLPPPWNVRTRVHEYGGGAFAVSGGLVCFSHDADQRVHRVERTGARRGPSRRQGPCATPTASSTVVAACCWRCARTTARGRPSP